VWISWDFGILLYLWGIGVYNVRDKNTPKFAETILQIPLKGPLRPGSDCNRSYMSGFPGSSGILLHLLGHRRLQCTWHQAMYCTIATTLKWIGLQNHR
jgi:hypothetical protein